VIVGGILRGYNRAFRISLNYCVHYFVLEAVVILALLPPLIGWNTVAVLLGLFVAVLLLFPTALAANLLFARLFTFRTWRNERWRRWTAAALGVVLTTIGMVVVGLMVHRPPRVVDELPGASGALLYAFGWLVLFSNLALLAAWLIPSRKS